MLAGENSSQPPVSSPLSQLTDNPQSASQGNSERANAQIYKTTNTIISSQKKDETVNILVPLKGPLNDYIK